MVLTRRGGVGRRSVWRSETARGRWRRRRLKHRTRHTQRMRMGLMLRGHGPIVMRMGSLVKMLRLHRWVLLLLLLLLSTNRTSAKLRLLTQVLHRDSVTEALRMCS